MTATDLYCKLIAHGFSLAATHGGLAITPANQLTDTLRTEIRQHKLELLLLLAANQPLNPQPQISEAVLLDKQQRWLRHLVGCEVCSQQWDRHLRLGLTSESLPYCSLQASQYAYFVMAIWSSTPNGAERLAAFNQGLEKGHF